MWGHGVVRCFFLVWVGALEESSNGVRVGKGERMTTLYRVWIGCFTMAVAALLGGAGVLFSFELQSTNSASENVWRIGPRDVPAPEQASAELRESIASAPAPDVEGSGQFAPSTREEWEAVTGGDEQAGVGALALAEALGLTVETSEIDGVTVRHVRPAEIRQEHADHLFVHLHGGGYVFGGGDASVAEAALIAAGAGITVLSVDYRMPPAHPFPAAVDDVVTVYQSLLGEHDPSRLGLGGTSAGAGLALAATHKFVELGLDVPGAIFAGTPWSDLTKTGDTYYTNEGIDRVLVSYDGLISSAARLYAGTHDLRHPLLSPIYGDFEGFPATYLVTGTRDLFLSDVVRTHRKMKAAGVVADLNVYEGVSHADYLLTPNSPESREVFSELGSFLRQHLK